MTAKTAESSGVEGLKPFKPLPWQYGPWKDKSPVVLLSGTAGSGKSRLYAEKIHGFALHYPGAALLIMRKTREVLRQSVIPFMQTVVIGEDPRVTWRASELKFVYGNNSVVYFGGMRDYKQREQVRSIGQEGGLDMCWFEEATAFDERDFNEILPRMRGKAVESYWISRGAPPEVAAKKGWRQIGLTTNPDHPFHWIKRRLIDNGEAAYYPSTYGDNTYNPEDYADTLAKLTGVQKKRLVDGIWAQAEGMVYDEFKGHVHVIEPFDIPESWPRYMAIDFGYTKPFVCLWAAVDGDGRIHIYREIYKTMRLVSDHAQHIKRLSENERITATICDWDAENRAQIEAAGIPTTQAIKDIENGIQLIKNRLRTAGDGEPRLFYHKGSLVEEDQVLRRAYEPTSTEQEFYFYTWAENRDGRRKEVPVDEWNHGLDALRYLVSHLDPINTVDIFGMHEIYGDDPLGRANIDAMLRSRR